MSAPTRLRLTTRGKIALAVLEGLTYLYEVHHIIHRGQSPARACRPAN